MRSTQRCLIARAGSGGTDSTYHIFLRRRTTGFLLGLDVEEWRHHKLLQQMEQRIRVGQTRVGRAEKPIVKLVDGRSEPIVHEPHELLANRLRQRGAVNTTRLGRFDTLVAIFRGKVLCR